jgi:hypothetical protein
VHVGCYLRNGFARMKRKEGLKAASVHPNPMKSETKPRADCSNLKHRSMGKDFPEI